MASKPVLVVMAAGMGSRYGGLKQIDAVGSCGEAILDYSLYDARQAGFEKAVLIIKEAIRKDFMEIVGKRLENSRMEIVYAYQELHKLPEGYAVPEGRVKPWGTCHAVLCAKDAIDGAPFAVINADDYYGVEAFQVLYDFLTTHEDDDKFRYAMVGYLLENTLTENGSVARGCCVTNEDGYLVSITERTKIIKTPEGAAYSEDDGATFTPIDVKTPVSMNMWGFTPSIIPELGKALEEFFANQVEKNPLKAECYLPIEVDTLLKEDRATVQVLSSKDKWFGVTYKEDKPYVTESIQKLKDAGVYPDVLWS